MRTLHKDQAGVAHLLLIVLFLIAFAGLGALAYTRVTSNNDVAVSDVVEGDDAELDSSDDTEGNSIDKADEEAQKEVDSAQ